MVGIRCGRDSHSFVDWMHFRPAGLRQGLLWLFFS